MNCFITVAFTSCSYDHRQITKESIIKFEDVKTAYGVSNMSRFVSTGQFTCQIPGLYQIMAIVKSHTNGATFNIDRNNLSIISGFVAEHNVRDRSTNYDHTGIAVVVVMLNAGDTVSVRAGMDLYLHSETCLSIFRV